MITSFRIQVLAVLLFGTQFATHAVELCVATNGSDTNPGTERQPLRSIQAAVTRLGKQRLGHKAILNAQGIADGRLQIF